MKPAIIFSAATGWLSGNIKFTVDIVFCPVQMINNNQQARLFKSGKSNPSIAKPIY